MASQKEMKAIREYALELFETVEFEGFEVVGQIVDGMLMKHLGEEESYVVFKPIVKKESFDVEDALAEFAEKEAARLEREAEREAKRLAREAKAKEKAAEEGE